MTADGVISTLHPVRRGQRRRSPPGCRPGRSDRCPCRVRRTHQPTVSGVKLRERANVSKMNYRLHDIGQTPALRTRSTCSRFAMTWGSGSRRQSRRTVRRSPPERRDGRSGGLQGQQVKREHRLKISSTRDRKRTARGCSAGRDPCHSDPSSVAVHTHPTASVAV